MGDSLLITWNLPDLVLTFSSDKVGTTDFSTSEETRCLWHAGFIANRIELIRETGLLRGTPDRDLLLHLYRQYGSRVAQLIFGSFAWVIWDPNLKGLVAVRDRMGNYGIYYAVREDKVFVSDRIELLLGALPSQRKLNPRSIIAQICGIPPLSGETFYEDIKAVEPGGSLAVWCGRTRVDRYWHIEPQPLLRLGSDAEYADAFRDLLFKIVAEYIPQHPIAITLSGGIDSTAVAAAIRAVAPSTRLVAFSLVAPELPEADEDYYSALVSNYLGISRVTIRGDLYWTLCAPDGIKTRLSTPDYGCYTELWEATYRKVRQLGFETLFSGISGDHLFGIANHVYPDLLLTGQWGELFRQLSHLPSAHVCSLRFIRGELLGPIVRTYIMRRRKAVSPCAWLAKGCYEQYYEYFALPAPLPMMLPGRQMRLDILRHRRINHIAETMNLEAGENRIEFRHPLLDHRLMEFAVSLPTMQTYRTGIHKVILRNAMRDYLPDEVVSLGAKIYPGAIADRGLKERAQSKIWGLLTNMRATALGFIDETRLQETYRSYLVGEHTDASFWYTVTL